MPLDDITYIISNIQLQLHCMTLHSFLTNKCDKTNLCYTSQVQSRLSTKSGKRQIWRGHYNRRCCRNVNPTGTLYKQCTQGAFDIHKVPLHKGNRNNIYIISQLQNNIHCCIKKVILTRKHCQIWQ
jgi:hypothetical protein